MSGNRTSLEIQKLAEDLYLEWGYIVDEGVERVQGWAPRRSREVFEAQLVQAMTYLSKCIPLLKEMTEIEDRAEEEKACKLKEEETGG